MEERHRAGVQGFPLQADTPQHLRFCAFMGVHYVGVMGRVTDLW